MSKTVKQWLEELPEEIRDQAISNTKPTLLEQDAIAESLREAISGAFIWDDSPQGHKYWEEVFNSL
jgi:hypothetical protein